MSRMHRVLRTVGLALSAVLVLVLAACSSYGPEGPKGPVATVVVGKSHTQSAPGQSISYHLVVGDKHNRPQLVNVSEKVYAASCKGEFVYPETGQVVTNSNFGCVIAKLPPAGGLYQIRLAIDASTAPVLTLVGKKEYRQLKVGDLYSINGHDTVAYGPRHN